MKRITIKTTELIIITFLYVIIFLLFQIWSAIAFEGWWYIIAIVFNIIWFLIIAPKILFKILDKQKSFKFILK